MMCRICGRLVRLGVYVVEGKPDEGMICWPCWLDFQEQDQFKTVQDMITAEAELVE